MVFIKSLHGLLSHRDNLFPTRQNYVEVLEVMTLSTGLPLFRAAFEPHCKPACMTHKTMSERSTNENAVLNECPAAAVTAHYISLCRRMPCWWFSLNHLLEGITDFFQDIHSLPLLQSPLKYNSPASAPHNIPASM
jgi:hypothetical protein